MQFARIPDRHRMALAEHRVATQVMATLARDSGCTEDNLVRALSAGAAETRRAVDQLYRAGLIRLAADRHWSVSEAGRALLEQLGLLGAINRYRLATAPGLNRSDRTFLIGCLAVNGAAADDAAILSLLTLASELPAACDGPRDSADAARRFLYAIVIKLGQRPGSLDGQSCYDQVQRALAADSHGLDAGIHLTWDAPQQIASCEQARCDVEHSDRFVTHGETPPDGGLVRLISWARVVSAVASGRPDPGLALLHGIDLPRCWNNAEMEGLLLATGPRHLAGVAERRAGANFGAWLAHLQAALAQRLKCRTPA